MLQDKDSLGNKIGSTIKMCMYMLCGISSNKYKQPKFIENSAMDSIYYRLTTMIDKGSINEAENIMYDLLNPKIKQEYYTMLCIYEYINDLDDEFLILNGFSKDEVEDGIREITELYDDSGIGKYL